MISSGEELKPSVRARLLAVPSGRIAIETPLSRSRHAIFAAARYLVASGAPGDMPDALYHYNNSRDYVNAVQDYAGEMRADPRAYYGYYYWLVVYARLGGAVILPPGFPRIHAVPVRYH